MSGASVPSGRLTPAAKYALGVLALVSFFNYMDRMVLAVLLEPIKQELGLSDAQLGLLSGFAFAALYATFGVPLARAADRTSRVRLLSACVGFWSLMTAAGGLSQNFLQLFTARMGVGVGEAGCVPAAHSLIGAYVPPAQRPFGVSLFQAGGLAGVSGGLVLTGVLADTLGWRNALLVAGLSGLPLALIIALTLKEPLRLPGELDRARGESLVTAVAALLRRPALRHLVVGLSISGFATYGLSQWIPTFFVRSHQLTLTQVGVWSGLTSGAGGIVGVVLGGWLSTRLIRRDARWELWLPAVTYIGAAPLYLLTFLAPTAAGALTFKFLAVFVASSGAGVALSAVQSFAEPHRRATAIAMVLFLSAFIGLGAGPLVIGLLSDALAPLAGRGSLRWALAAAAAAFVWAATHLTLAGLHAKSDRVVAAEAAVSA